MNMKEKLLELELPDKYEEDLFQYIEGLDNIPEWPELFKKGYTRDKHLKFRTLVNIECTKYMYKRDYDQMTDEERLMTEELIQTTIDKYNDM